MGEAAVAEHSNRLAHESSPYLQQHAHNPVDWYPWGPEALERARREDRPIFLSIGYSACHWCHVMERESFEDEQTARLMNEHFVNIKVDREERPDIDHIYMDAVQLLTGRGGWPLSVFLTPEGKPFYGGTYFPPEDRYGMPGFRRVLLSIAEAFRQRQEEIGSTTKRLMEVLQASDRFDVERQPPGSKLVIEAASGLARVYDTNHGGLGRAPKFPNAAVFELFLRVHRNTGDRSFLDMVLHTLRQMALGGIYDQLGGGFHRYSVDEQWLVPHFEKMLYDNALLVPLYLSAYQVSGDLFFATVARETIDYVLREMRHPEGGFYSTQDADSEGEEGRFFVWDREAVHRILGDRELAEIACRYWDVTEGGNFEGRNILRVATDLDQLAASYERDAGELRLLLGEARARLFAARARRPKPARDEKILTSWNGLMISALAKSAELFGEESDRKAAVDAARFVTTYLQKGDRLLSTFKDGSARLNGYLDDYAFFAAALLDLFEAVQEPAYLDQAVLLTDAMVRHFGDTQAGGFFFTSDDHEELILRTKPSFDGSIPSGNSLAVRNLLRLSHYTGATSYLEIAAAALRQFAQPMQEQPLAHANMLAALDFYDQKPIEIVLVSPPDAPAGKILLEQIQRTYLPNRTLTVVAPGCDDRLPPPVRGKGQVRGKPTVYVCHNMTCSPPVTSWAKLEPLLRPPVGHSR
jgi:uncharacterized protein